jgi:anti-sigma B factor antagonist
MAATPNAIPELKLEMVKTPEEILVHCIGKISSANASMLQTTIRGLIPETKRIVLDLTEVNYLDSSGLGALVTAYLSAKRQHCELRLVNLNKQLKELFRVTKLASIFEGHDDFLGMTPD